jgi:DNA-nicking Smr family endonuclease
MMRDATPLSSSKRSPVDLPEPPDRSHAQGTGSAQHRPAKDKDGRHYGADGGQGPSRKRQQPQPAAPSKRGRPDPGVQPGRLDNLDRRTADRLKRGRLEIDGRIDLHGLTRAAAQDALTGFLARAADRGQRCILVITGKGTFSEGPGILKQEVPRWLNMPPLSGRVVAVTEAQPRHGGSGAFYVLLKRKRG